MRRVTSLDEYYALVKAANENIHATKTNDMLSVETLQRYVSLGRLLYELVDAGHFLFTDEGNYYQGFFHVDPKQKFAVSRKDKPVLIQNVYKGEKKPWVMSVEENLRDSGFVLADTLKHGVFIGYDGIPKILRSLRGVKRIFEKEGLVFAPLRRDQIPEMLAFQKTIDEVPFYQFPYYTDDEYMEEAEAERLCCVMNAEGRIIAARHLIVNGKKTYGWVGIEDRYKIQYGIALVFLGHALDYIEKHDLKMCSWVKTTNIPSLQYHERLGTEWTGHMEDEWLME